MKPVGLVRFIVYTLTVALMFCFLGVLGGYSYATGGELPFMQYQSITPPEQATNVTSNELTTFLESDDTDFNRYDIGFNCVEYALLLEREAQWKGIPAISILIKYEDGSGHIVMAFPIVDKGWIYIEPQTDEEIYPNIGAIIGGKRIAEMYSLTCEWILLEDSK